MIPIIETYKFLNGHQASTKIWLIPIILIAPAYRDNKGLIAHEMEHAKRAWKHIFPPIYALRYALSKSFRLAEEVHCYKVQLTYSPGYEWHYAGFIATRYGLDITQEEALKLLTT
jgi:hypothetical protein